MGIQGFIGVVVAHFDVVPVPAAPGVYPVGNGDGAIGSRKDGGAARSADVGAAVVVDLPSEGIRPVAEPRGDGVALRQRPLEDARSFPVGIGIDDLPAAADVTAQQFGPQVFIFRLCHQGQVFVLSVIEAVLLGHFLRCFVGDGDFQNGFCHRFRAGNLVPILICGSHLHRTALRAGGVADGVHLPHDTPQFIHLGIIQRGHLGAILCARHFCGEYRKDIFPIDRQHPVVGGDLLPVMGVGGFNLLNVRLVFSVEVSHRLGHAGSGSRGL